MCNTLFFFTYVKQFQGLEMNIHNILSGVTKAEPGQQCDEMPC